ncbi:hypothetical protein FQR65_LT14443 [Abscondita terminalis]|nr:hypothetical protein FQR65_LT14443 [Abscondita terminalis]
MTCNKENVDDLHDSYEPAGDSDLDPDFDPNNPDPSKKKLPQFFNEKDFVFPEISQTNSVQRGHKKNTLIDYKNWNEVFPSAESWETESLLNKPKYLDKAFKYWNSSIFQPKPSTGELNQPVPSGVRKNKCENRKVAKSPKQKTKQSSLKPPCKGTCRKKCFLKINEKQREYIFNYYTKLNYANKQLFLNKYINKNLVKYRKVDAEKNKQFTATYSLSIINEESESSVNQEIITVYHAPNRRYLSSDITIHDMHKDYNSKNVPICYETYRKVIKEENIGFSTPSQDGCGQCSIFKQQSHSENEIKVVPISSEEEPISPKSNSENTCSTCENYKIHKQRYTVAWKMYNEDVTTSIDSSTELYAVDMQKVLIIPKMSIKNSFFVSRLVVFHETFANLKSENFGMKQ